MSQNLLPFDHEEVLQNLPSYNRINNTLLLIETVKNLPNPSFTCLDAVQQNDHLNQEDSLGEEIKEKQKISSISEETVKYQTSDHKKKKNGCTCKKTKCLKMYCECFTLGKICTPQCACYNCCNTEKHRETIDKAKQNIKTKSSRKNNQGCTCKKSQCQKKYCECFNAGMACTQACKCCDCQNHKGENSCDGYQDRNLELDDKSKNKGIRANRLAVNLNKQKELPQNLPIIESMNSQSWISQLNNQQKLDNEEKAENQRKFELTTYKSHKYRQNQINQNLNLSSLKSFSSLDLCVYFN